ncbi:MAG: tRNA (guanosine(37)-N1)-methyltransferase TrmD [Peptococcaceae bacterium]|nr:tRNA (guanosine(37)-N1)-methyltransferase TrmD [Peptococcaceae bacterium]
MQIDILTLFPGMFQGPFDHSIIKRAREKSLISVEIVNIRDFSRNKHHTVDDTPYGGGAGMVMAPDPVFEAAGWIKARRGGIGRFIYMSPDGDPLNQRKVRELAAESHLVILCGHYEGVDERVRDLLVTDEISIGDYVLTGGELPAMVLVDAVARLIPGVLGEPASAEEDSFSGGLLEYPHYTRPRVYGGLEVPEVLLNGHHEQIRLWRRRRSLLRTLERRPDLLAEAELTGEDRAILKQVVLDLEKLGLPEEIGKKRRQRRQETGDRRQE